MFNQAIDCFSQVDSRGFLVAGRRQLFEVPEPQVIRRHSVMQAALVNPKTVVRVFVRSRSVGRWVSGAIRATSCAQNQ